MLIGKSRFSMVGLKFPLPPESGSQFRFARNVCGNGCRFVAPVDALGCSVVAAAQDTKISTVSFATLWLPVQRAERNTDLKIAFLICGQCNGLGHVFHDVEVDGAPGAAKSDRIFCAGNFSSVEKGARLALHLGDEQALVARRW